MPEPLDKGQQIAVLEMMHIATLIVNAILRKADHAELDQLAREWIVFRDMAVDTKDSDLPE